MTAPSGSPPLDLRAARRQLLLDGLGIVASAAGFGFVLGLAARDTGISPLEVLAMSTIVFAGASQFTAVGALAASAIAPSMVPPGATGNSKCSKGRSIGTNHCGVQR